MRMFLLVAVRSIFHGALFLLDLLESLEFQSRLGKAAEFSGVEWISNLMAWGQTLGHLIKVHQTVDNRSGLTGYRSNRSGPVLVWSGLKPDQIQNLNLNSKKMKNSQKIPKNTSRCDESNGVKFSQKFVHLICFAEFIS